MPILVIQNSFPALPMPHNTGFRTNFIRMLLIFLLISTKYLGGNLLCPDVLPCTKLCVLLTFNHSFPREIPLFTTAPTAYQGSQCIICFPAVHVGPIALQ